jgi:hypothetical protein
MKKKGLDYSTRKGYRTKKTESGNLGIVASATIPELNPPASSMKSPTSYRIR